MPQVRLTDLDPHWLFFEGRRVGFIFKCPLPNNPWWQTCFVESFQAFRSRDGTYQYKDDCYAPDTQAGIVARSCPKAEDKYQLCKYDTVWQISGGIENASFETLTVTPSIDGSPGGNWHGYVTDGMIVGGL